VWQVVELQIYALPNAHSPARHGLHECIPLCLGQFVHCASRRVIRQQWCYLLEAMVEVGDEFALGKGWVTCLCFVH